MIQSPFKIRSVMLTLALSGYIFAGHAQAQTSLATSYGVTDVTELLDFQSSAGGYAADLNDDGQIVGSRGSQSFVARTGEIISIPFLDKPVNQAVDISNDGLVTGNAFVGSGTHAFKYGAEQVTDIDAANNLFSYGNGINNSGQIAGYYQAPLTSSHRAYIYSGSQMVDIAFPAEIPAVSSGSESTPIEILSSEAQGINSSGQATGFVLSNGFGTLGFLTNGTTTKYLLGPEGAIGDTFGAAINTIGNVAGYSLNENRVCATLWTGNGTTPLQLAALSTTHNRTLANDINDNGQIVGLAKTSSEVSRAVLWQNGQVIDLNTLIPDDSGWLLQEAVRINNRGEILGRGLHNGEQRQFILTLGSTDTEAPVTTASFEATAGNNNWFVDAGQLVLTAQDGAGTPLIPGSGVGVICYSIDGGPTHIYSEPIPFESSGLYNITYWSQDNMDNVEEPQSFALKIDRSLPVVNASRALQVRLPNNKELILLSGKMTDTFSGIKRPAATYAITDEYGQFEPTGSVVVKPNGTFDLPLTFPAKTRPQDTDGRSFTVTITGFDKAGNFSTKEVNVVTGKKGSSNFS